MERVVYDRKKYRKLLVISILFLTTFAMVTYSLDLFPGGYKLDYTDTQSITITKKDIQVEQYKIERTEENVLKFALLELEIMYLKNFWLISIIFISTLVLTVFNLQENYVEKARPYALITSGLVVALIVIVVSVYMKSFNFIEKIISGLIM